MGLERRSIHAQRVHPAHAGWASYWLLVAAATGLAVGWTPNLIPLTLGVLAAGAFASREALWWLWRRREPRTFDLDAPAFEVSPTLSIPKSRITAVKTHASKLLVQVWHQGALFPVELVVDSHDDAEGLADALGFGPERRVLTFPIEAPLQSSNVLKPLGLVGLSFAVVLCVSAVATRSLWLLAIALGVLLPLVVGLFWERTWAVGVDGYAVSWLGFRRFVPYANVEGFDEFQSAHGKRARSKAGVRVSLAGGRVETIVLGEKLQDDPVFAGIARLSRAIEVFRKSRRAGQVLLLTPGDRSTEAWLAELHTLAQPSDPYRAVSLGREELWTVLEDAASPLLARAGAAVTLGENAPGPETERLRAVAEASACQAFREVIDRVVGDARADLPNALADLRADVQASDVVDPLQRPTTPTPIRSSR